MRYLPLPVASAGRPAHTDNALHENQPRHAIRRKRRRQSFGRALGSGQKNLVRQRRGGLEPISALDPRSEGGHRYTRRQRDPYACACGQNTLAHAAQTSDIERAALRLPGTTLGILRPHRRCALICGAGLAGRAHRRLGPPWRGAYISRWRLEFPLITRNNC